MKKAYIASIVALGAMLTAPTTAQLLPGGGGGGGEMLGGSLDRVIGDFSGAGGRGLLDRTSTELGSISETASRSAGDATVYGVGRSSASLAETRRQRLDALIDANRRTLERDDDGNPVRRSVLVAMDPTLADLTAAMRAGFRVTADERDASIGIRMVTFAVPARMTARKALKALRSAAPGIEADYDHVYEPAGGALAPALTSALAGVAAGAALPGRRIGMIDGGVASHPSLGRARIEQRGFAGSPQPTGHGTAVASLLVGDQSPFRGAARGAHLFAADVYGGNPAAGSATAMVRALAWLAAKNPQVVTISLIGPANRAVARTIGALRARGVSVVAAVGNDGPAAPPQFPASYDGVIAVTGVDAKGRALFEASRSRHLDFAAPGADLAAATPGRGYARVRGTSFAAPLVAARLAATGSIARLGAEARPGKGKVGRGIVCYDCRIDPKLVGAR